MKQLRILFFALLAIVGVACSKSSDEPKAANYLDGKTFVHSTKTSADDKVFEETTMTFTATEFTLVYEFKEDGYHTVGTTKGSYSYSNGKLVVNSISTSSKDVITGKVTPGEIDADSKVVTLAVNETAGTITNPNDADIVLTLKK